MDIPLIERTKIQAQVLVPLIKALQAELGEQRANGIVRKALGDLYRKFGEEWSHKQRTTNLSEKMASTFATFAADGALDYDVVRQTPDAVDINVTGCRYANFYNALGEPELGFLIVCSADFPFMESTDVQLDRTQTIMQGASHCDFRFQLKKHDEPK